MRPSDRTSPRVNVISRLLISPSINRDRDEPELLRRRLELASRRARREKSRNRTPNREMTCRRVGQRLELRFSKSFSFESANLNLDSSLKLLAAVAFSHLSGWRSCISKLTENSPPFSSSPLSLSLSFSLADSPRGCSSETWKTSKMRDESTTKETNGGRSAPMDTSHERSVAEKIECRVTGRAAPIRLRLPSSNFPDLFASLCRCWQILIYAARSARAMVHENAVSSKIVEQRAGKRWTRR